jgi:alkylation response protein AidB-like acyl-CoA dehydrogenase
MQTRAVEDGDDYIVNGQKIWTTFGHYADWGWLAARTDPDVPKHKGLSTFAIDMKTPGITVRPLMNMAGTHEFNEIFFDNVRIPKESLVGEKNRGWYQVAVGLEFERSSIGATSGARKSLENLVSYARATTRNGAPLIKEPSVRHKLADLAVEVNVSRLMSYQVAYRQTKGDLPGHQANVVKTFTMELNQRIQRAAVTIGGLYGQLAQDEPKAMAGGDYGYGYLRSVANTIEGGTSEVNRSVIATRGLGLPRE